MSPLYLFFFHESTLIFSLIHNQNFSSVLMAQIIKDLPIVKETWVQSLSWENSLNKGMASHSSILAWRIQWTEKSGRLQSLGLQRVGCD